MAQVETSAVAEVGRVGFLLALLLGLIALEVCTLPTDAQAREGRPNGTHVEAEVPRPEFREPQGAI